MDLGDYNKPSKSMLVNYNTQSNGLDVILFLMRYLYSIVC